MKDKGVTRVIKTVGVSDNFLAIMKNAGILTARYGLIARSSGMTQIVLRREKEDEEEKEEEIGCQNQAMDRSDVRRFPQG